MNPYKWKHATKLQRIKWKLKQELKHDKPGIISRLKIMVYKQQIETIRRNQFLK